ncbi:hypothetical protein HanIR_Chr08g0361281 [Helianthus annuus]|nr:hypothetical protein HanIR_Chr08g0361281 [Helianthus annuus]
MKNLTDVHNRIQRFSFSSARISINSSSVADATLRPRDSPLVIRQEGNIESLVKSVYEVVDIEATRMVMWFHMTTVSMQPWRIYPLCLIVYKSEPHNRFVTSTIVLVYICYLR